MSLDNKEPFENDENDLTESSEVEFDENAQNESSDLSFEEDSESHDDNETEEQSSKRKSAEIILNIICVVVIIVCLVILGRNLFFKNSNKESASSSKVESTLINAPDKIKDVYILADLPYDYEIKSQDISDTKAVSKYKNKKDKIVFTQSTIADYKPEYDVNDENIIISNFGTGDGQTYKAYQIDGKCYIVWTTDEYTFEIKTHMKKSESIPLIFNVQKSGELESADKTE